MNDPGYIKDITGRYVIGLSSDPECSAPTVVDTHVDKVVGVYIDDSTPNIDEWVATAVSKYRDGLVIVTIPSGRPHLRHHPEPPILNLYEIYPFHSGFPVRDWFPLPDCEGYCVQDKFWGFKGTKPPNRLQHAWLMHKVRAKHPKYIFLY